MNGWIEIEKNNLQTEKKAGLKDIFTGETRKKFFVALDVVSNWPFLHRPLCIMINKLRIFLTRFALPNHLRRLWAVLISQAKTTLSAR